jgi:SsrA-binding protein
MCHHIIAKIARNASFCYDSPMPTLLNNQKAHFNYEILERFQAGIEVVGHETKSLREKLGILDGSYVTIRGGEAYIINMFIPPYQTNNTAEDYNPRRNRRLLLTKKEILQLSEVEHQAGLTIVPISVYNNKRWIKVEIAIVRGKKQFDKRETIKKRDSEREIRREHSDR